MGDSWWADQSCSSPGPESGLWVHPNIHCIYDLLESMKELVLQIESCKISTTQVNNTISKRSPSEGPPSIDSVAETRLMILYNEHLEVKIHG